MRLIRICQWTVEGAGSCNHMVEGNTDYCGSHNSAIRKAERDAMKEKKVYKIPNRTPKRAAQERQYLKLNREYLEANPCCEVRDCHERSSEVHHMGGRENERLLDVSLFLAICHGHHDRITNDKEGWAIREGYSILRTGPQKLPD